MASFTRKNVWSNNNGGQFQDTSGNYTDLFWYAKAIQVMQSRPISNPVSWWFYGAIHGEFLINRINNPNYLYLNWPNISYITSDAKLGTLPSRTLTNLFWNQCQHGTWFFPPWHRGYLVAIEIILRNIITNQLDGPKDWALPYWNYLNQSSQYSQNNIPPAFTVTNLPDGSANPLLVPQRYGTQVEVGPSMDGTDANDECQWDKIYESSSKGGLYDFYYGGGETGFSHGGSETGDLEMNPHNFVHGMVGSQNTAGQMGLMGVPGTAALDPIFFLHHANIDRMWDAWIITGGNSNPIDPNWLKGPSAGGNSRFAMPVDANAKTWYFTPDDVQSTTNLQYLGNPYTYTYDDLALTSYDMTPPKNLFALRMRKFGVDDIEIEKIDKMSFKKNAELVGASEGALSLKGGGTEVVAHLDRTSWKNVERSLFKVSSSNIPDEIYLQLEGVRGGNDTNFISVYINEVLIKSVSLFGLLQASTKDSLHGGAGLSFKFNITDIIDDLHFEGNEDVDALNILIKTKFPLLNDDDLTIDRVGIYRLGQ